MKRSLAIVVCTVALALAMFAPSKASAGGRYYGYGSYYGYGCCCVSYCWVRGRGFNRPYAHPRYRYDYGYSGDGYSRGYPLAHGYARRGVRRGW